jgi:hypothetical protein
MAHPPLALETTHAPPEGMTLEQVWVICLGLAAQDTHPHRMGPSHNYIVTGSGYTA